MYMNTLSADLLVTQLYVYETNEYHLRPLSSEMDPTKIRLIRKDVIKERGAEGF
jgi:hypothetical protein